MRKILSMVLPPVLLLSQQLPQAQQHATFSTTTSVVTVNVTVTDRAGKPVENLTKADFQVLEDGKQQRISAVDLQRLTSAPLPPPSAQPTVAEQPKGYNPDAERARLGSSMVSKYQDRRLMVLLFDLSSMQAAEQIRAKDAAVRFLNTQMSASDTVAIMTYSTALNTVQDFTTDRELLISTINKLRVGDSSENATTADTGADSQDTSGTFVADETEFNILNVDLKLAALEQAARTLGQYPEKKALVYLSSGIQKSGVDNQSQLRATVNAAVRANVAFYPIDARGLSALVPGGDASQQGAAGSGLYNGSGQRSARDNFNNQQETLATLAMDTGGKALLDSNDLTEGIRQAQSDISTYYVISYVSTNTAQDGKFRRIQVKLAPAAGVLNAKIDYRKGYYASNTFKRMRESEKEAQLSQALLADNPMTDLPLAVEVDYFRLEKGKYFVPISAKIPGSALAFHAKGAKQSTELDFLAEVFDARNRPASTMRDTIPLKVASAVAGQVVSKSVQYDTGVTLSPGNYKLRFLARENGEGKVGTYETNFTIPDLATRNTLRVSSVVVSSQRSPVAEQVAGVKADKKLLATNPLIDNGQRLEPSVTRVFRPNQTMLVYAEVYDPAIPDFLPENFRRANVQASFALYSEGKKIFETAPARANRLSEKRENTVPVWMEVALAKVPPGKYTAQLNLIDQFGRKFAFPRTSVAILADEAGNSSNP